MSVERQVLAALKWTSLAKLVGQILSWGVTLVVLRLLVPADYGLMAIVSMIITVLASIAELGLGASLVQAPQLNRDDLGAVTGAVIVLNLGIGVLVALLAPLAAWFYTEPRLTPLIQFASLHFLLNALGTIPQAMAYRDMNFRWLAWVELAAVVTSGLATLGLAWHGYGVWALLMGSLLQNLVRTALLLRHGMPLPVFRRQGLRRHVTFGGTFTATRLITQVVYQSDIFIAGILLSQQAIGLYSVSLHVATLPMQKIMGVINQVAFPAVAKLQHDRARLRQRMLEATRLLTVFSLPVLWGLSAVAPEFVATIMGSKWGEAVFPLQAICLVIPLRMLNVLYTTMAVGVGNMQANVVNTVASAIVLPATFYIGGHWGVNGLALAWVIAIPFVFFYCLPRTLRLVDTRSSDLLVWMRAPVVAGAIMYAAVGLGRLVCEGLTPAARLAPLIVLGGSAYVGMVLLLDRQIVPDVLRVLRAMRS
jgi:O-antigen/teichoic acid export membrane protein